MRLKRIELAGFKSFVDPVKIELGDGITAIVGPNGSGKSNIVDAIRWVLGEHSARQLRGGVMDDLIFQGSETRPPVGICDVELTFAVQTGQLPSPWHDMDEIRIRRRLMREGGSDAFINGKMVRLKDIVDIFLDTGISTRAYAIIEQGSITRMVSAKPEERRAMLEEAAGVMKYRSRRREAERKMKDTGQNLERAKDLLDEVRSQCRSLKQQASRAERFKKMQDEWQETQALAMGIRFRQLRQRQEKEQQELKNSEHAETEMVTRHAACERQVNEAREQLLAHEEIAQTAQDSLRAAEQKRGDMQRQAERLAGERRLLEERLRSTGARREEGLQRHRILTTELATLERKLAGQNNAALNEALNNATQETEQAQQQHDIVRAERDKVLAEFERLRGRHADVARQREQAEINLTRMQDRQHLLGGRETEINGQLEQAKKRASELNEELANDEARARDSESRLERAQQELDVVRGKRNALEEELNNTHAETRRLQGEVEALKGRSESGGIDAATKRLWRESGAVWVDESLQVGEGLDFAVAAALRGEDGDVQLPAGVEAGALKEQLQSAGALPVAFHTHTGMQHLSGSLGAALGLDSSHPLYAMFAGVLLVDDIITADAALQAESAAHAAVSRDGWRLETGGWLLPPVRKAGVRRLAAQRELRQKTGELKQAEMALSNIEQRFNESETTLNERQQQWQQAHIAATEAQSAMHARKAEAERVSAEIEALDSRLERLRHEHQELTQEQTHWAAQANDDTTSDTNELQQAEIALATRNEAENTARQQLDQMKNSRAAAEQALALHRQAEESLQRDYDRLHDEAEALARRISDDKQALADLNRDIEQTAQHQHMDAELQNAAEEVEKMHRELNALRQQGHELQQQALEHERQEHRIRAQWQERVNQRQQHEVALAAETARSEDMQQEIQQRCQQPADQLLHKLESMQEELDESAVLSRASELEDRLNRFGPVNLLAIDEYEQAAEREMFLASQAEDLESSLNTLTETIARIDRTTRQRFKETFEQANAYFKQTFPRLFGGGKAELRLDGEDLQTAGVDIIAQPPGKCLQDIGLLSGGEKALTAVALVFSIFRIKPAPFCILDEVDAPLDDANVGRFGDMVREFCTDVQFLNITHNKVSMQMANRIIGVSMPESGVSRIVGVDLEVMTTGK